MKYEIKNMWNTWSNRSTCSFVHLSTGLAIHLHWKLHNWIEETYIAESLIGRKDPHLEKVSPEYHTLDGSYTKQKITCRQMEVEVETTAIGEDYFLKIRPINPSAINSVIISVNVLWNKPGILINTANNSISFTKDESFMTVNFTEEPGTDYFVQAASPYRVFTLDKTIYVYTGKRQNPEHIEQIIQASRSSLVAGAEKKFGSLADSFLAIQAGISWNIINDPSNDRIISTVGRLWNEEYGGYCLFGWDNFFLPLAVCLDEPELAVHFLKTHFTSLTDEGFIPNDDRGNKTKSFDRSQPPVGSLLTWLIYLNTQDESLLNDALEPLYRWNRWWLEKRLNGELLSYGSHNAFNPLHEPHTNTLKTAKYESGMDDSPMYSETVFNQEKGVMELWDCGLNFLYLADCIFLKKIADEREDYSKSEALEKTIVYFEEKLSLLKDRDIFKNFETHKGLFSDRISPTIFYPLISQFASDEIKENLSEYFWSPQKFGGEWILPSVPRDDPDFAKQCYWKGAVWPPLNFLSYLGFKFSDMQREAASLAEKSQSLFLKEWTGKNIVCENYSSITGTGDDAKLSSDAFHSWGVLMGLMEFIEKGYLTI